MAVIGMGCRLPGVGHLDDLRRPPGTDVPVAGVDVFDSEWFGLTAPQAAVLDPRLRLALEVVVEAIDDAGIGYRLRGSDAAVVVAVRPGRDQPESGRADSAPAQGISRLFELYGPSSQVVTDRAVESGIRLLVDRAVPWVIVVGVDVEPDDAVDGAVAQRDPVAAGESRRAGCAVLVLQRVADARRAGSRVHAVLEIDDGGSVSEATVGPDPLPAARSVMRVLRAIVSMESETRALDHGATATSTGAAQPLLPNEIRSGSGSGSGSEEGTGWGGKGTRVPGSRITVLRNAAQALPRSIDPPVVIAVSGRDRRELGTTALRLAHHLRYAAPHDRARGDRLALHELACATTRQLPLALRAAVLAADLGEADARLRALAAGATGPGIVAPRPRHRGGLLFVFAGPSEPAPRLGRAPAARFPAYAEAVAAIADAIRSAGGPRIWTARFGFRVAPDSGWAGPAFAHLATFAHQVAVARLLEAWDVRPSGVCGYGAGEIAAAAVSGALTTADAARVAVEHSRTVAHRVPRHIDAEPTPPQWENLDRSGAAQTRPWSSALLLASIDEAARLVAPLRHTVTIAAARGPQSVVISGYPPDVDTVVRRAMRRGLRARALGRDHPADPVAGAELAGRLAGLTPRTPRIPFYSTVRRGGLLAGAATDAAYWGANLGDAVHFDAALVRAIEAGASSVLTIGPSTELAAAVQDVEQFASSTYTTGGDDEAAALLHALAALHAEGRRVDWARQGPFTVPPPRRRWRHTAVGSPLPAVLAGAEPDFDHPGVIDHLYGGCPAVPVGYWVSALLHLARRHAASEMLTDLALGRLVAPDDLRQARFRDDGPGGFRVTVPDGTAADGTGPDGTVAVARPVPGPTPADIVDWMRLVDDGRTARRRLRPLGPGAFYTSLRRHRVEYGPRFPIPERIETGGGRTFGVLSTDDEASIAVEQCLHLVVAAARDMLTGKLVPEVSAIGTVWLAPDGGAAVEAHATVRERAPHALTGDVVGTDRDGVPLLALRDVRIRFREGDDAATVRPAESAPFRTQVWLPVTPAPGAGHGEPARLLVVGDSATAARLARATDRTIRTDLCATPEPAAPDHHAGYTAAVLVWPHGTDATAAAAAHHALDVLRRLRERCRGQLTLVLPRPALRGGAGAESAWAAAALARTLRAETGTPVRVVWADDDPPTLARLADLLTGRHTLDDPELRIGADGVTARRLRPVPADPLPAPRIDPGGTYVVTGGLGRLGAVAVRWLLDAGARDVVVLTRAPRPVPAPLDGLEDRFVVVRCDVADRAELAAALGDIREDGATIRGLVHAAEVFETAAFAEVTAGQLIRLFEPKVTAARHLLALTAHDPTDFVLLFTSAAGTLGAPGRAAYAAASAAADALAGGRRRVLALGWEIRRQPGGEPADLDGAAVRRGAELLGAALRHRVPHLLIGSGEIE
ncbi:SDR family NAD(P)-dependent oxidoreductase [Nocardia farcinica]|uniref:SDR family NAD(P)-dependent oxidoreductase n=1 Tax=Nocardia farcinica TaxID=37329 RepID=UPI0024585DCE|nr:SDR family NAD(P)-dependent oxidoreductase [Nocardia farcinica]